MEGPTPVSALIHAATMVTAGVYLIARFHPLFDRAPVAQGMVACVGIGTAVMAGVIALSQIDIKRVIAYSTMSQIGLMIFAVGIGAYSAAMFHFATHAVFKALLFMAAGNVIHALHDEQDIRLMGGLAPRHAPHRALLPERHLRAGRASRCSSGFFSKEGLLGFGLTNGPGACPWILYVVGLGVNVLTGLYAFRLWATVFRGEPQTARVYAAHEAPPTMLVPVADPRRAQRGPRRGARRSGRCSSTTTCSSASSRGFLAGVHHARRRGPLAIDLGAGAGGDRRRRRHRWRRCSAPAWPRGCGCSAGPTPPRWSARLPRALPLLSYNKFYFDELYDAALVRPTVALARALRRVVEPRVMDGWVRVVADACSELGSWARDYQTGLIRDYASYMIAAAGVFVVATIVLVAR